MVRQLSLLTTAWLFVVMPLASPDAVADQPVPEVNRHLAGGEFAAAKRVAAGLPDQRRDGALAEIATVQGYTGEPVAAAGTVRGISTPAVREQAIEGAAGGGAFADFQSLIDLIQTTVVPDTWETLGGPSTMAPYPAGVYVDPEGTVMQCESFTKSDPVAELKTLLAQPTGRSDPTTEIAWRSPSAMRCVSLRRLRDELARRRIEGIDPSDAMTHLAGLSRVQYLFLEDDDIIIAGPVGGIENQQGWFRDRSSGLTTLRLDFLLTCLSAAISQQPFGCTIDPTTEGLQRASALAAKIQSDQVPIGMAAEAMTEALGMQRVEVFGTAGDTPVGYLMVEADRHMKQLALGLEPMPRGVANYLDIIDASIDRGPPDELLLRLWFTAAPQAVRADEERRVFELAGTPIRLSGQNERALASGKRGQLTKDFRSEKFVAEFNRHWTAIRDQYPIYAALESIYRTASVSELVRQYAESSELTALAASLQANATSLPRMHAAPRQVLSIAKLHSVRHRSRVHHVVLASGGVSVDPRQTLVGKMVTYPALDSVAPPAQSRPTLIQRWWWDAKSMP